MLQTQSWPYSFPASEDFPKPNQRGKVRGKLVVRDRLLFSINFLNMDFALLVLPPFSNSCFFPV